MSYTILSAAWSNDPEAVVVETAESGAVVVSQRDRPDLWAQLMASGVEIAPRRTIKPKMDDIDAVLDAEGGPEAIAFTANIESGGSPGLKATSFRKGKLRGTIYDFQQTGAELPTHSHDEGNVHISIVARGRVSSKGNGWARELVAGDVIAFRPGQEHNIVGLEAGSRVVNIVFGG